MKTMEIIFAIIAVVWIISVVILKRYLDNFFGGKK